jgi:hypothetical protein
VMPVLRESYEDSLVAAEGADLLVSHILTFTTRLVAEKKGIPWASTFLQPLGLFSVYDPPVLPQAPLLAKLRFLGPAFHRLLFWFGKRSVRSWSEPLHRLRAEVGLPPMSSSPLFEGQCSPLLVLALFSKLLADKQPDWPLSAVITGFPVYDQDGEAGMPLSWSASSIVARRPLSLRSVHRRWLTLADSTSTVPPPPSCWAEGLFCLLAKNHVTGQPPFLTVSWHSITHLFQSFSQGLLSSSTREASGQRARRCAQVAPCWLCPTPTTSPTTPSV